MTSATTASLVRSARAPSAGAGAAEAGGIYLATEGGPVFILQILITPLLCGKKAVFSRFRSLTRRRPGIWRT